MSTAYPYYVTAWATACLVSMTLLVRSRERFELCTREYWRWLRAPWKLATFAIASCGLALLAPYTGDPTWDYVDAAFMAILTFATAPWAIGVLYRTLRGRATLAATYVAVCLWMFSASWSYDLYLLLRNGAYPVTWAANIGASSVLYASAGLLWNLEWKRSRGVVFGFMEDGWPSPSHETGFARVFAYALPFMLLAGAAILWFVLPNPFAAK